MLWNHDLPLPAGISNAEKGNQAEPLPAALSSSLTYISSQRLVQHRQLIPRYITGQGRADDSCCGVMGSDRPFLARSCDWNTQHSLLPRVQPPVRVIRQLHLGQKRQKCARADVTAVWGRKKRRLLSYVKAILKEVLKINASPPVSSSSGFF